MRTVQVEFEGLNLTAELLDSKAPKICQAIWDALPLQGQVTNTVWSGDMLRLWVTIPEPPEPENLSVLQNPGDIIFLPGWNGLRFIYGPAQMRGPRGPHPAPRVGRLVGDLGDFVKIAKRVEWEGAKAMRLTRGTG
ncbi:MAG: DUF3830 family protein [Candidatus Rokubacteria bacterium]|nr:DUF3830 family protein [Candidatus Rokubacteria bacterium]